MNTFHQFIQKVGTGILAIVFAFITIYTPIPHTNNVPEADASGVFGKVTDLYNGAINTGTMIWTAMSAGLETITANAAALGLSKESWLDAIAWGLAKSIISEMTSSIVDWINNGFEGSPAFVQDLEGFLLNVADKEFGSYLEKLGGPLSMLCSPFKLDIQIAVAIDYQKKRTETTCTLSEALKNIDDFVSGDFSRGGWDAWFEVISNPTDYTKYGSYLNAQAGAAISILGQQDKEEKMLAFGGGFLSAKVCDNIDTPEGKTVEKCKVSTPGKVIADSLNKSLGAGQDALIEADEVNEIIAALFGQLAKQAITGAAGLLGLSNDTGYTTYVYDPETNATSSITSNTKTKTTINEHNIAEKVDEAIALEEGYYDKAVNVALPKLLAYAQPSSGADSYRRSLATDEANRIKNTIEPEITALLEKLYALSEQLKLLPEPDQDTPLTKKQRQDIIREYSTLKLHNKEFIDATILSWDRIYRRINNGEAQEDAAAEARVNGIIEDAINDDNDSDSKNPPSNDGGGDSGGGNTSDGGGSSNSDGNLTGGTEMPGGVYNAPVEDRTDPSQDSPGYIGEGTDPSDTYSGSALSSLYSGLQDLADALSNWGGGSSDSSSGSGTGGSNPGSIGGE